MRLTLHPNDPERLNVEVALSADEAEEWVARLQTAVRNAREGRGDQLLLLGEPARIVVSVREWEPEPALPHPDEEDTVLERDRILAFHQSRLILLALIVLLFLFLYRFRILPI